MIKVRCFGLGGADNCHKVYTRVLEFLDVPRYGRDITFCDDDSYTHAVILNTEQPELRIPKSNVLGLAFEPNYYLGLSPEFIQYAIAKIGRYYIGSAAGLPLPFMEHHGFMWYCPFPRELTLKDRPMSIIFSQKTAVPGHQYRHTLVDRILQTDLPVDIWGRGCMSLQGGDSRVRGTFTDKEPYEAYRFSVAIENFCLNDYISEKYVNCLVNGVTPLYLGARHVERYFPGMTVPLTGNIETDLAIISTVLRNPDRFQKKIDRLAVLSKMNLIDHMLEIWTGGGTPP